MKGQHAPRVAAWMLAHMVPAAHDEALEGDLLEELRAGRGSSWYRRQVLGIIATAWRREFLGRRMVLLFAALWSTLAPGWLALAHTKNLLHILATVHRFDFPWSVICPVPVLLFLPLAFVWAGLFLSAGWNRAITRQSSMPRLRQGFARGSLILMPVWMAAVALRALLAPNSGLDTILVCAPFFVATLCATWDVSRESNFAKADGWTD
jgi:hypothetical protein